MNSTSLLLDLLSASLGNTDRLPECNTARWRELIDLSDRQGVLAIVFRGVQNLPEHCFQDSDVLIEWLGQSELIRLVYPSYKETLSEVCCTLTDAGFQTMLLKGYGCSLNYPDPELRPCGDIDLWLFGRGEEADKYLESKGVRINRNGDHHSTFVFGEFNVENHRAILDPKSHKSNAYLNDLLECLAAEGGGREIPEMGLVLPSARFNSIHLLRHMASDFATVRTTLRNVLDWSTFVANNDVDWDFVHDVAHKSNMHRFLDAINAICVDYLGYPPEKFPVEQIDKRLEERVLNEILTCADSADAPDGNQSTFVRFKYAFKKTRRMLKNRWKYRIVYDESLLESFVWKVKGMIG